MNNIMSILLSASLFLTSQQNIKITKTTTNQQHATTTTTNQ